ncbi:MAG: alpha/beta fold hydrolase [Desulfobacteraceae bacterium]|nr:alpha/beta fold hydrolase [Desulfobacteraceae bacterium]
MNPFAFELTSYTLKTFSGFSKANINISGIRNIPQGSVIFTANHFTRIETIFLPYHIHSITKKDVWSLAADDLFKVNILKGLLKAFGGVSTKDPNRDNVIVKTLFSGNAQWIIFPEGMMVKNKKLVKKNKLVISKDDATQRPHTGAAIVAMRCEFYRERLRRMKERNPDEFERLINEFEIDDVTTVLASQTHIVPVNITYYPANPKENILSKVGQILVKTPSKRVLDELMTEGSMLFSGVDITIRFGPPISISPFLSDGFIESDLSSGRRMDFDRNICSGRVIKTRSVQIMEEYMSSVYLMTCFNYDHIMACILKHFPYRPDGIDPYEFQCKVFCAVVSFIHNRTYYFSDNFLKNQTHLLIDDRFHRIKDFLNLAQETGIIKIKENRIFKDQTKFVTLSDFHAIRIENPILVMANEVEPVWDVEQHIKSIAQKSMVEILDETKSYLIEKIATDFTKDYNEYYIEGESKKKRVGRPVYLKHPQPKAGVLLIHGYMAAPEEMKVFANYLHEHQYTVYAPRLKGHGTAPEDLAKTEYKEWIESVEEAFIILRHTCDKVILGGFSTGAGLALELASRVEDVKAIFAVSPPMQLKDFSSHFVPTIDAWNSMIKKIHLDSMTKEFVVNNPENPHINYVRNPISGVHQLENLMEHLAPKLKSIELPVLVVQSRNDPVVNPKGTVKLFKKLGSPFKEYYMFDYDRHGILTGKGVKRIFGAIKSFLEEWI